MSAPDAVERPIAEPLAESPEKDPTKSKGTPKPRRRRGRPRCTCTLYGVCEVCKGIADRRSAAELRRRRSSDGDS